MRLSSLSRHFAKASRAIVILCLAFTASSCGEDEMPVNSCLRTQEQKQEQKLKDIEFIRKYFTDNKIDESLMQKTESGIFYQVLKPGTGAQVKSGDLVHVDYIGKHLCKDLTVVSCTFDSSFSRGKPYPVTVGQSQVIAGWHEALQLMKAGETTRFFIPSYLAYGICGSGSIYANENLMFDITVVSAQ